MSYPEKDTSFKIIKVRHPGKIISPEEKLERRKRMCQSFLDKCKRLEEGATLPPPTAEQVDTLNKHRLEQLRLNNKKFRETHREEYHNYMNLKMKEKYKNNAVCRMKELERSRLKNLKIRESKELLITLPNL